MNHNQYETGTRDQLPVYDKIKDAVELKDVIDFIASDKPETRLKTNYNENIDYFPTKKLKITVDKEKVLATGTVKAQDSALIVDEMTWSLASRYILKNDLMILDLVANSNWERPIYFVAVGPGNDTNLRDYFQCEGFAYRLVPIKTKYDMLSVGRIDTDDLYDKMMNKFRWGNMGDPKVYLDENIRRTLQIVKLRGNFGRLAIALEQEGKHDSALAVLNRCLEVLPIEKVNLSYYDSKFVDALFECNHPQAAEIVTNVFNTAYNDLLYYAKLPAPFFASNDNKRQMSMVSAQWIIETLQTYNQTELFNELNEVFTEMYGIYSGNINAKGLSRK
jgi:hypothetical protein